MILNLSFILELHIHLIYDNNKYQIVYLICMNIGHDALHSSYMQIILHTKVFVCSIYLSKTF